MTPSRSRNKRKPSRIGFMLVIAGLLLAVGSSFWWGRYAAEEMAEHLIGKSHQFRVAQVYVVGNRQVAISAIKDLAKVKVGTPIFDVSTTELRMCLLQHPWIQYATVRRHLPDALEIRVWEREAAASLNDEGTFAVTSDGKIVAPLPGQGLWTLPVLHSSREYSMYDGAAVCDSSTLAMLKEALKLRALAPDVWRNVSKFYCSGNQLRMQLAQPPMDILLGRGVSETDWAGAIQIMRRATMQGMLACKRLDLRVPGKVIIGYESLSAEEPING